MTRRSKTLSPPGIRIRLDVLAVLIFAFAASANALTWSTHGPIGGRVTDVAFSPAAPRVVYVSTTAGIFRSDDGGDSWRDISGSLAGVTHVTADPTNVDIAFATTQQHLYKTTDGGATWHDLNALLPDGILPSALRIDPSNPSTIYLGSRCGPIGFKGAPSPDSLTGNPFQGAGVYKSVDGGATWTSQLNGLTNRPFGVCVEELALDPQSPQSLFASPVYSDGGYSQSFDGGATWSRAPGGVPASGIVVNPSLPNVHYGLSAIAQAYFVSFDGGLTWQRAPTNGVNSFHPLRAIDIDPQTGRLFLATDSGLFRSGDGGVNWIDAGTTLPVSRIAVDRGAGFAFAATPVGALRMPLPLGEWSSLAIADPSANVVSVAGDPIDPSTAYALTVDYYVVSQEPGQHARVFVTHDRGASWQQQLEAKLNGVPGLSVDGGHNLYLDSTITADPRRAGYIYRTLRGFASSLQVSRDGGRTFTNVTVPTSGSAGFVAIDPSNPSTLYVASEPTSANEDIAKSTDSGVTWNVIYHGGSNDSGMTVLMAVAPSSSKTLYRIGASFAACPFGYAVYRSDDSGVSWTHLTWPEECRSEPRRLIVDPRDARSVWILSGSGRIVHTADGGATWEIPDQPPGSVTDLAFSADGVTLHAAVAGNGVWEAAITGPHKRPAGH